MQLRLTKIALLIILVGLSLVERRTAAWPITTWPMYGRRTTAVPPPAASGLQLRVTRRSGEWHTLTRMDFFPMGMTGTAETAMEAAVDDSEPELRDAHRSYLRNVVKRILHAEDLDTIEVWRLEWPVDPLALPPLDRARPIRAIRLGAFSASLDAAQETRP